MDKNKTDEIQTSLENDPEVADLLNIGFKNMTDEQMLILFQKVLQKALDVKRESVIEDDKISGIDSKEEYIESLTINSQEKLYRELARMLGFFESISYILKPVKSFNFIESAIEELKFVLNNPDIIKAIEEELLLYNGGYDPVHMGGILADKVRQQYLKHSSGGDIKQVGQQNKDLPTYNQISPQKTEGLLFPLTKYHDDIFTMLSIATAEKGQVPGQLSFSNIELMVEGQNDKGNKKERSIFYSIMFNEFEEDVKVLKALTDTDRRVYDAISTLYNAGNEITTISQINKEMGNKSGTRTSKDQAQRIKNSMRKMSAAWITIDQSQDYAKYIDKSKGKIGASYKGQLLYYETVEATINGVYVEEAIHILREPVLFRLAKDRNQITTIPKTLLKTGKKQTNEYFTIENYLITRISKMKHPGYGSSNHIKYSSIFKRLKDGTKKSRIITTVYQILEVYKAQNWIKGYEEHINKKDEPYVEIFY